MSEVKYPYRCAETVSAFYGYNKNPVIADGELYDMKNLTSSCFPALASRNRRVTFTDKAGIHGLFGKEKLVYVSAGNLYYGGNEVSGIALSGNVEEKRCYASLGAYLLIFPEKKYVNTNDLSDCGDMEASFETAGTVIYSLCRSDSSLYEGYTVSAAEPESPSDGALWLDTAANELKQYSSYSESWVAVASTYVRIAATGIGANFSVGDGVTLSGSDMADFNTAAVLADRGDDFITVTGILSGGTVTQSTPLTVTRSVPDMDFVCSGQNRVWGCSSEKNEIYSCKLGDFKNWNVFSGLTSDSYTVSAGSDGDFTGAAAYLGYVMFFKEDCIHKVYNINPPFNVTCTRCAGVQKGSGKSIALVNGSLYYKSPCGVCEYSGGAPTEISRDLGTTYYSDAVGGAFRGKYYVCMTSGAGTRTLFVYDTARMLWHREDNTDVLEFAGCNSNLYFISLEDSVRKLHMTDADEKYGTFTGGLAGFGTESAVPFEAVFGLWGLTYPYHKYISGITLRFAAENAVSLYAEYDCSGTWESLGGSAAGQSVNMVSLPLRIPKRCDTLRLKICGTGAFKLYSITKRTEEGSELL